MNKLLLGRWAIAAALLGLLAGCESEVQHGLDEKDANEIRYALSKNGIPCEKKPDTTSDKGGWMITVPKGEVNRATEILVTNRIPRNHPMTRAKIYTGDPGLVPTENFEKNRELAAEEGGLTQALESIEGVLSATVNINIPETSALDDKSKRTPPTAAVVVVYRRSAAAPGTDEKPPVTEAKIKQIVAHSVDGLTAENVDVSLTPQSLPGTDTPGESFVDIAGLRMSVDSVVTFKIMVAVGILLILALAGWIGMLYYSRGSAAPARPRSRGAAPEA